MKLTGFLGRPRTGLRVRMAEARMPVITGLGVVSACGIGLGTFWRNVASGQSRITRLNLKGLDCLRVRVGGVVGGFDSAAIIPRWMKPGRLSRQTQFALCASMEAFDHAGLVPDQIDSDILVMIGTSSSHLETIQSSVLSVVKRGTRRAHPHLVPGSPPQASTAAVCDWLVGKGLGVRGITLSSACAAGLDSIGHAARAIENGDTDIAIAGGSDAPLSICPLAELDAAGLANTESNPRWASRPFDSTRQTGVLAEGASVVVLESLEHAFRRGAAVLAEVAGYAHKMDSDASAPGHRLDETISEALANARARREELDYVCAWGPGHPVIDPIEVASIRRALGKHAQAIPVSSIKGVVGNPLAAAGPMQVLAACLGMSQHIVPPTANLRSPDPQCDLDHVALRPRRGWIRLAACNGHGIGGGNATLLLRRRLA